MRAPCTFLGFALAALFALPGCGAEARDATSKELSALTAEISKLRAEQASISERLEAIERGKLPAPAAPEPEKAADPAAAAPPTPATRSLDDDRPALDVVRLGPTGDDSADGDGDIDADGPRTVLRSGASGIIVEEQSGPGATTRTVSADPAKKTSPKKTDKTDRKKTAALPTP
jgi:anti-sigma factor RsiW